MKHLSWRPSGFKGNDQILSCGTYDGDEEATMGSEVTHIVAEAEHAVHAAVGVATSLVSVVVCFISFLVKRLLLRSPPCLLCVQELKELLRQHPQAVAVQADWLDSCFAKQRQVDAANFLHVLR